MGKRNSENLIQSEYERLTQSNSSTTASDKFNIGETVTVYEDIPDTSLLELFIPSTTVKSGEYTVYQVDYDSKHPIKISMDGNKAGLWIDSNNLIQSDISTTASDEFNIEKQLLYMKIFLDTSLLELLFLVRLLKPVNILFIK